MFRFWAILLAFVLALPALGQAPQDRLTSAYVDWLAETGTTGIVATGQHDAQGGWTVTRPEAGTAELASVGKSITAICVLSLVQADRLAWSDRLPDILGEAPDVSVAQLITHTSGLAPDSTQAVMGFWLDPPPNAGHHSAQVLTAINARDAQDGVAGRYLYSNENYALLGLVIEAVSGEPYDTYCRGALDLPASIQPSPRSGAMQPWGGFVADPVDFLTFLEAHFGPDSEAGSDPFALPHADMGGGAFYGLGMVFREFGDSYNFWHFGALCFPGRLNVGSYAVLWEGKVGAVALYDGCIDWPAMQSLDGALSRAVYP